MPQGQDTTLIDHPDFYSGHHFLDPWLCDDDADDIFSRIDSDALYNYHCEEAELHEAEWQAQLDMLADPPVPSHGSQESLSMGRARALRYFIFYGYESSSKLAVAEIGKRTRKPGRFPKMSWKRRKAKQWQTRSYRWVGPNSLRRLPVKSVLDPFCSFD